MQATVLPFNLFHFLVHALETYPHCKSMGIFVLAKETWVFSIFLILLFSTLDLSFRNKRLLCSSYRSK
ncbi:hypothetical protein QVD17_06441 [Tagetes erecta]|uniref:Uncharacterized protein n=1 Tax=Tagetes erecta TaxID=13708 RepID=A0AAD8PC84_TARER|nr:hypothetical protein QVD17_06441 [Tagetes erecta]